MAEGYVSLAVLCLGYAVGRLRPVKHLDDAAWWRGISSLPRPSKYPTAWAVLWLALHPSKALGSYRAYRRLSANADWARSNRPVEQAAQSNVGQVGL